MLQSFKGASLMIQIIIILALLTILGTLTYVFIRSMKEKEETEAVVDLGDKTDVTDDKLFGFVKDVPVNKRVAVLKDLHSMNLSEIANSIRNAKGTLSVGDDDEDAVYGAFGKIRTQIRLGMFLDYWKKLYGSPLMDFLSFLDATEKTKLAGIISKFPKY